MQKRTARLLRAAPFAFQSATGVPAQVNRRAPKSKVPKRPAPMFRDREELSAASDLGAEVRAALAASRSLIVVCSPAAAASKWVSREVEVFRALHPDRPVLAVVRGGEPPACFPEPLRPAATSGQATEPLAADSVAQAMVRKDPGNALWQRLQKRLQSELGGMEKAAR